MVTGGSEIVQVISVKTVFLFKPNHLSCPTFVYNIERRAVETITPVVAHFSKGKRWQYSTVLILVYWYYLMFFFRHLSFDIIVLNLVHMIQFHFVEISYLLVSSFLSLECIIKDRYFPPLFMGKSKKTTMALSALNSLNWLNSTLASFLLYCFNYRILASARTKKKQNAKLFSKQNFLPTEDPFRMSKVEVCEDMSDTSSDSKHSR